MLGDILYYTVWTVVTVVSTGGGPDLIFKL